MVRGTPSSRTAMPYCEHADLTTYDQKMAYLYLSGGGGRGGEGEERKWHIRLANLPPKILDMQGGASLTLRKYLPFLKS